MSLRGALAVIAAVEVVAVVSAALVVATAFFDTETAETPEELAAVRYGWPLSFAESDATMGASPHELRGSDWTFPTAVPFNPWEHATTLTVRRM